MKKIFLRLIIYLLSSLLIFEIFVNIFNLENFSDVFRVGLVSLIFFLFLDVLTKQNKYFFDLFKKAKINQFLFFIIISAIWLFIGMFIPNIKGTSIHFAAVIFIQNAMQVYLPQILLNSEMTKDNIK